jgi:hypothetical protein
VLAFRGKRDQCTFTPKEVCLRCRASPSRDSTKPSRAEGLRLFSRGHTAHGRGQHAARLAGLRCWRPRWIALMYCMRSSGGTAPVPPCILQSISGISMEDVLFTPTLTGHCPPETVRIACETLHKMHHHHQLFAPLHELVETEHRITPASELANRLVHAPRATAVRRGPPSHLQQG